MSIMILLPSATAFVPTTYADPPTGGGDEPDCSDELDSFMGAMYAVIAAEKAYKDARNSLKNAQKDEAQAVQNYQIIKGIPLVRPIQQNNMYYPYNTRAEWVNARDTTFAAMNAAIAATNAAKIAQDNAALAFAQATLDEKNAWNTYIACIHS